MACIDNYTIKNSSLLRTATLGFLSLILILQAQSSYAAGLNKQLRLAAKAGDVVEIRRLLADGADINAAGKKKGRTPLHIAAKRGNLEAVEFLIRAGADVNSRAKNGSTPLISAAYRGYTDIVQTLLANGADKYARSNKGNSAMDLAEKYDFVDTARVLEMKSMAPGIVLSLHFSDEKSKKVFQAAAVQALTGRGWSIRSKETNRVDGELKKGRRIFRVVLELIGNSISIKFLPYFGFHRQNYLQNIRIDLEKILAEG